MPSRTPPSSFQPDFLSLVAVVAGLGGVLSVVFFDIPGWFLIAGLGLIFFGIAWELNERFQSGLQRAVKDVMDSAQTEEALPEARLRRQLVKLKYEPGKSAAASELEMALTALERAHAEFWRMLVSRLAPEELTHDRFASVGAEVKNAGVRSLAQGMDAVIAVDTRVESRASATTGNLRLVGSSSPAKGNPLLDSLELNQRAIQGLKKMSEALLSMQGDLGDPARDLERALKDLRDLAARAGKY